MGFELKNSADKKILQSDHKSAEDFYTDKLQTIPFNNIIPFEQIEETGIINRR